MSKRPTSENPELTAEDIDQLTAVKVKELLRERALKVSGTKSVLVARLKEACGIEAAADAAPAPAKGMRRKQSARAVERAAWEAERVHWTPGSSGTDQEPLASVEATPAGCCKVAAWNVASLRAMLRKGTTLADWAAAEGADVVCLGETKVTAEWAEKEGAGVLPEYPHRVWACADKSGYSGTVLFSKAAPLRVVRELPEAKHNTEGRLIAAEFREMWVVHTYVPNSGQNLKRKEYRTEEWDAALKAFLLSLQAEKPTVWMGDLNVAHGRIDVHDPVSNKNKSPGFTDEERANLSAVLDAGWVDTYRAQHPTRQQFSFWGARFGLRGKNKGWRLDYVLAPPSLPVRDAFIRHTVQGSDHVPVGAVFEGALTGKEE